MSITTVLSRISQVPNQANAALPLELNDYRSNVNRIRDVGISITSLSS